MQLPFAASKAPAHRADVLPIPVLILVLRKQVWSHCLLGGKAVRHLALQLAQRTAQEEGGSWDEQSL